MAGSLLLGGVFARFQDIARANPQRDALRYVDASQASDAWRSWSYQQLLTSAQSLAAALNSVKPGDMVGVVDHRSPATIATFLALRNLNATFVPIDLSWPVERLRYLFDDTKMTLLIGEGRQPDALDGLSDQVGWLDALSVAEDGCEIPAQSPAPERHPAYVMYTSGSTGQPKGVVVLDDAILRLVVEPDYLPLDQDSVMVHISPQSFDASTLEIWGPLLNGGTCVLYPGPGVPDLRQLGSVISSCKVNTMWLTSSLFNYAVDTQPEAMRPLRYLLTGGEALSVRHVCRGNALLPDTQLINGYGPTENTTFTACYQIPKGFPESATSVPIGVPIRGTTVRITNASLEDVGDGSEGELLAGGCGVALGYLNQPELTKERFVKTDDGSIFYRTGDLVRRLADGNLEFIGRADQQIKLHGHRIELGEIDSTGASLVGVSDFRCIVQSAPTDPGADLANAAPASRKLVAYFTGDAQQSQLRAHFSKHLPQYCHPSFYVRMDRLPVNANGKLDTKQLHSPLEQVTSATHDVLSSNQPLEASIKIIWSEVIGSSNEIGNDANFFDVGGASIDLLSVGDRLQALLGREVSVLDLLEHTTIKALSTFFRGDQDADQSASNDRASRRRNSQRKKRTRRERNNA